MVLPAGKPASFINEAKYKADNGVYSEGFNIIVLPAASSYMYFKILDFKVFVFEFIFTQSWTDLPAEHQSGISECDNSSTYSHGLMLRVGEESTIDWDCFAKYFI